MTRYSPVAAAAVLGKEGGQPPAHPCAGGLRGLTHTMRGLIHTMYTMHQATYHTYHA